MSGSSEWVLGYGYVRIWEELHRAEELALAEAPEFVVVAEGMRDLLRLKGSSIENRDELILQAHGALAALGYPVNAAVPVPFVANNEALPREVLRNVRRAINEYRDERREGLMRARNHLYAVIFATGLFLYALLALAILVGVPAVNVRSAAWFFLIGSIVGLFNRLYLDASADTATQDYGLATARMWHTPLVCGLAALGGAMILPLLSAQISPTAPVGPGGVRGISVPTIASLFSIPERPFSLVLSAIFGLTPGALISRLQAEAEKYKSDLKMSEAPASK